MLREYAGKLFRAQTWRKLFTLRLRPRTIGKVIWSEAPPPTTTGGTIEGVSGSILLAYEGRVANGYQPGTALTEWKARQTQEGDGA